MSSYETILTDDGAILRPMKQIPQKLAAELILVGEPIDAPTAHEWGLVNHVVPEAQLLAKARELARGIVAGAPLAIAYSKAAMKEAAASDDLFPGKGWEIMDRYQELVNATEDAAEGPHAFAEKRRPQWSGR